MNDITFWFQETFFLKIFFFSTQLFQPEKTTSQSVQVGTRFPKEMYDKHKRCVSVRSEERRVLCFFLSLFLSPLWVSAWRIVFHCSPHHSQTHVGELSWLSTEKVVESGLPRTAGMNLIWVVAMISFFLLLRLLTFSLSDDWSRALQRFLLSEALLMLDSIKILKKAALTLGSSFTLEAGSKLKAYLTTPPPPTPQTRDVEEELGSSDPHSDSERISFPLSSALNLNLILLRSHSPSITGVFIGLTKV